MEGYEMKAMKTNQLHAENNTASANHHLSLQRKLAIVIMAIALATIGIFYFVCYINGGDMRSVYEAVLPYLMSGILILSLAIMGISLQK